MAEPKIYVPKSSAKQKNFDDGGSILRLSFKVDDFIAFLRQHRNEKGYVNLCVTERKSPSQYGDTHCVWLDTWKPKRGPDSDTPQTERRQAQVEAAAPDDDEPPF